MGSLRVLLTEEKGGGEIIMRLRKSKGILTPRLKFCLVGGRL